MPLNTLIANIGGTLALFLGASVSSVTCALYTHSPNSHPVTPKYDNTKIHASTIRDNARLNHPLLDAESGG